MYGFEGFRVGILVFKNFKGVFTGFSVKQHNTPDAPVASLLFDHLFDDFNVTVLPLTRCTAAVTCCKCWHDLGLTMGTACADGSNHSCIVLIVRAVAVTAANANAAAAPALERPLLNSSS